MNSKGAFMKATILDLRYHMKDVLRALERSEVVQILYHGKLKGILVPPKKESKKNIEDHPFFGMCKDEKESVDKQMQKLRGDRYNAF